MPKNPRADETILNLATSTGESLRTTIPSFIKYQFDLQRGDVLRWSIDGTRLIADIHKRK